MPNHSAGLVMGVLGVGRIGRMHAAHLALHPDVATVVLLGRHAERLRNALPQIAGMAVESEQHGSAAHEVTSKLLPRVFRTSAQNLGVDLRMDGLVVATSTDSHTALVTEAAGLGVPLLIEKPLASSDEEQVKLIKTLDESGVQCMMGYHRRFDDDHRRLRRQVQSGALGAPRGAVAVSLDFRDAAESYVPTSGGLWRDLAVHDFNALAWILDEQIVSVSARSGVLANPMYEKHNDVDTASATLTFSSGVVANILCGRHMGWRQETRLEVHGTEGSDSTDAVSRGSRTHVLEGDNAPRKSFTSSLDRFKKAYINEIDEFVKLAQGLGEVDSPPAACLAALRVAQAAEQSSRTGRTVRVG